MADFNLGLNTKLQTCSTMLLCFQILPHLWNEGNIYLVELWRLCVCVCVCVRAQPGPTLCNPRLLCTCSHPGSSVPGIFQARILEQVAISSSRGSSQPRDQTHISCISCTGRSILYHLKTGIVPTIEPVSVKFPLPFKHLKIAICIFSNFTVSWIPWNQS